MRKLATATMAVLLLAALAVPAAAHVTANPDRADAAFVKSDFRVGHGCDGSPVTALRIQIPEEVDSVRPQPVAVGTSSSPAPRPTPARATTPMRATPPTRTTPTPAKPMPTATRRAG